MTNFAHFLSLPVAVLLTGVGHNAAAQTQAPTPEVGSVPLESASQQKSPARPAASKQPVESKHVFALQGWHVWDGCIVKNPEGTYSLFFSRWPSEKGHDAWVTHSEICRAVGPTPLGPFENVTTILSREETNAWDAHVFHNVTVKEFGGSYYIYYTGNRGNGKYWDHRNNQRIGVAFSQSPEGPWQRLEHPIIDISTDSWDSLCVANPTVTDTGDGRYKILYKGVTDGRRPFGSKVLHGVAYSDSPQGPFTKIQEPILNLPGHVFAFEDPYIWREDGLFKCLLKDMKGVVASHDRAVVLLTSDNGRDWKSETAKTIATPHIMHPDGRMEHVERLERPHYFSDGPHTIVTYAVKPKGKGECFIILQPRIL